MSSRSVLEQAVAGRQVQGRTAASIRDLQQRAYRGAIRTAKQALFVPNDLTIYTAALSLDVLPGRWTVTAEATFIVPAPTPGVAVRMTIGATDPVSGEPVTGSDFDFPIRRFDWEGRTSSSIVPITVTGTFVGAQELNADRILTISILTYASGNGYSLEEPRLLLMPW